MLRFIHLKNKVLHLVPSLGVVAVLLCGSGAYAQNAEQEPKSDDSLVNLKIVELEVEGNKKVERDAIVTIIESKQGELFDREVIASDIRELYKLGYFEDIRVTGQEVDGGVNLVFHFVERPSISEIVFEGFEEIGEKDFEDKLETKIFTIVDEAKIGADVRMIEKQYVDKGFYLADASYELVPAGESKVKLVFKMVEGVTVKVGDVEILGNKFFSDGDIVSKLMLQPLTRINGMSGAGSIYQDDFLKRDLEFISYMYRDNGFMDVKISKPIVQLDQDRRFVRITFEVEEGIQYYVGDISFSGDLLFKDEELRENNKLEKGNIFRISHFQKDVQRLVDKYGDLGYAFADINPKQKVRATDTPPSIDVNYEITKGEKMFFGVFNIVGNVKTRDNVIRRELEVAEGELYHGTKLSKSKSNIERLGFFESVQFVRERDPEDPTILNYTIRTKHKPTGQLQAALGFQPGQGDNEAQFFGQGRYNEANQSGYGWRTNLSGKWNGEKTYSLELSFTNPRVDDGPWSLGFSGSIENSVQNLAKDINVEEKRITGSVTIGRKVIELIRASITYRATKIESKTESFVLDRFKQDGLSSSVIFALTRNTTNNYLDPTEGSDVSLSQVFTGGPFGGDFEYMESIATADYFWPIDFSETYRTYFHFKGHVAHIYPNGDKPVPILERYRLGGYNDLRGYGFNTLGPKFSIVQNPQGKPIPFNKGGDKEFYAQAEYYMPLIAEAGIKGLFFADIGRVYDEDEALSLTGLKKDFGFGMRWITPVAPFRFEWAYPYEDGKVGDMQFIFYLGY